MAGLLCAVTTSIICLPVLLLLGMTGAALDLLGLASGLVAAFLREGDPERIVDIIRLLWTAFMLVCVVPLVVCALVGEIARVRSWFWYAGATGALAAAMPLLLRAGTGLAVSGRAADAATQAAEHRFILLFCLTGVVSGTIYWLVTARRRPPAVSTIDTRSPP